MNKLLKFCSIASLAISTSAFADAPKIAVGANIGTLGIGVEGRTQVNDNIFARVGWNYFNSSINKIRNNYNYKVELNLMTVPLMLDFHPFDDSGFRVSAGFAYNDNYISIKGTPTRVALLNGLINARQVTINGRNYTSTEIGNISGKLKLGNKISPIVSLGYDSSLRENSAWSFNTELGIIYTGKSKLDISSSGGISNDRKAQLIKDIEANTKKHLIDHKTHTKYYPIFSVGVKYSF